MMFRIVYKLTIGILALVCAANILLPQAPSARKASPEAEAKILRLQLQASRTQANFQYCQGTDFQAQLNQATAQMQAVIDEAFKEAKLDKKDYDLNLDTFEFVKKAPKP